MWVLSILLFCSSLPWLNAQQQPYVITEGRLKEIRAALMYPFADDDLLGITNSSPQVQKNLFFNLPFFGFRFNYTRVSLNGYLEFSDPPENYQYPLVFPSRGYPERKDPSFIGIFFSLCRMSDPRTDDPDQRPPGVYFRVERDLGNRTDQVGVETRERVKWDVREGVIGAQDFNPKHVVITTWRNVTFLGSFGPGLNLTNSFQMVLATDEVTTYAMFNYQNLDWTTHTEAGGDSFTGSGGIPAYIGFNAGNGTGAYEYQPYSQSSLIRDVTETGLGDDIKGRHIFRIDEEIIPGSCNSDLEGANLPLVVSPRHGNMLGGSLINITGPCFQPTDVVTCRFNADVEVPGVVLSRTKAMCVQPRLMFEGDARLQIRIGNGSYAWTGHYFINTPADIIDQIVFKGLAYLQASPTQIDMTWDRDNLTTTQGALLQVSLWGYREDLTTAKFLHIADLASDIPNSGLFTVLPVEYQGRDDGLTDVQVGFIQINVTERIGGVELVHGIWTLPTPLAWFFSPQWERRFGPNWAQALCESWMGYDRALGDFIEELPACPCTLTQALAQKGRLKVYFDNFFDLNITCLWSWLPTSGGGQQRCCYYLNDLITDPENYFVSLPMRVHDLGSPPWNQPRTVPTLSQWSNDLAPLFMCCSMQNISSDGCQAYHQDRRPVKACTGDNPHSTNSVQLQAVMGRMPLSAGLVGPQQVTGYIVWDNSSVTEVEIKLRPVEARWRYGLDVVVDSRALYFEDPSLVFQHFKGVGVNCQGGIVNPQDRVLIMFPSGSGLEVVQNGDNLTATLYFA